MSLFSDTHSFEPRAHIQDMHGAKETKVYWGYATRVLPCTNDAGSCEYLDAVYWMHTVSMLYTFIMWIVIGVILLFLIFFRLLRPERKTGRDRKQGFFYRSSRAIASASRQYFLKESFPKLFPYSTRLQGLILAILCIYLTIFSFIGIVYKTWVTPIKDSDLKNTRSGLGGFADRVGALAFALTPLTVALCSRDSILSLLTGIPYQNFNFLHRWTGRIILIQSFIHAISWTIIEGKLYQPQPTQYTKWIVQRYMIWGIAAQTFISFLFVFSLRPVIRWTGYEFFRKSHLVIGGLYLGACWGHWEQLACWMCASLIILGAELTLRFLRVFLIHFGYKDGNNGIGFRSIRAKMETFKDPSGTIVRMNFSHPTSWKIGQHFYLTFPALSIWQSHPFTVASAPPTTNTQPSQTYIIRARNGETGKLAALAESLPWDQDNCSETPVVMLGPYGCSITNDEVSNILTISGGTGISFTLPLITAALSDPHSVVENIEMIWIIRHIENLAWIGPELAELKAKLDEAHSVAITDERDDIKRTSRIVIKEKTRRFRIRIFVTRAPQTNTNLHALPNKEFEVRYSSSSACSRRSRSQEIQDLIRGHPNFTVKYLEHEHPSVSSMVNNFIDDTVSGGRTQVVGSGPAPLGTQIRATVAARNAAGGVWRGDEKRDVECVWDDRLG